MFSIIHILLITLIDRRSDTLSLMHIDYYGVAPLTILLELHNIQVGIQMAKGMNQNIRFSMKNKSLCDQFFMTSEYEKNGKIFWVIVDNVFVRMMKS